MKSPVRKGLDIYMFEKDYDKKKLESCLWAMEILITQINLKGVWDLKIK